MGRLETDRRSLLMGAPAVAALAAVPAIAAINPDSAIISAWADWQRGLSAIRELGDDGSTAYALWDKVGAAEDAIRSTVAKTPRGVTIQLLLALAHEEDRFCEDCAIAGDAQALYAADRDQDWNVRLMIAALRSLDAMGA